MDAPLKTTLTKEIRLLSMICISSKLLNLLFRIELISSEGKAIGGLVQDNIFLSSNLNPFIFKFVHTSKAIGFDRQMTDGFLGLSLSNRGNCKMIVTEMFEAGKIKENMFTIFYGKRKQAESWIIFDRHTNDESNITWHQSNPNSSHWDLELKHVTYGSIYNLTFNAKHVRISSDIPAFSLPRNTLLGLIQNLRPGLPIYQVARSPFYAIKCSGRHPFEDIIFHLDGYTANISKFEYLSYTAPY